MASKPTAKRRRLARRLRELRARAGMTHEQAAECLGCRQPKISKIENAQIAVNADDVRLLCDLYGAGVEVTESLVRLARDARKRGWYHSYGDALSAESLDYMELETDALSVSNFEIDLVPGLLQTEDYARAVIHAAAPDAGHDMIEKRVELRMTRQGRLDDESLSMWAVVDEAALRRPIGSTDVHRAQLSKLLDSAERPNVQFQVLPFDAREHMTMGVPFSCFRFDAAAGAVAIDHLTGTLYLEDQADVDRYSLAFQHLCSAALNQRDSLALVRRYVQEESSSWERTS